MMASAQSEEEMSAKTSAVKCDDIRRVKELEKFFFHSIFFSFGSFHPNQAAAKPEVLMDVCVCLCCEKSYTITVVIPESRNSNQRWEIS